MKNKSFKLFALTLLFNLIYFIQFPLVKSQESSNVPNNNNYIISFDTEQMIKKHLTNYELIRKRAKWNYGREFVYKTNDNNEIVFITVGLHPSVKDAENIAIQYLNEVSIVLTQGPHNGISIGDKYWWLAFTQDSSILTNIVFIRKNALIIMNSDGYKNLQSLAKLIDEDIIKGESYLSFENIMITPEVKSMSIDKNIVKVNEYIKITIDAIDPRNESLEYQFLPGLIKYKSDPENVFTIKAYCNHIQEPPDTLTVKMVVINESNVVSPVSTIKTKIIK